MIIEGWDLSKYIILKNNKAVYYDRYRSGEGDYYLETSESGQVQINKFYIKDDLLYAEIMEEGIVQPRILIWNTFLDKIQECNLEEFNSKKHYPKIKNFKSFDEYYDNEWNGWRSWLLP